VELASETGVGHSSNFQAHPSTSLSPADPAANPFLATPPADMHMSVEDATYEDSAPSRQDLLQRAAELGPFRMTWESIVVPSDPILSKKMEPTVVERRARFRKVVKAALGGCVAFCLAALVATAFSSSDTSSSSKASASTSIVAKTAPAMGVVPVEKLETPKLQKAKRETSRDATATVRHTPKKKRRR